LESHDGHLRTPTIELNIDINNNPNIPLESISSDIYSPPLLTPDPTDIPLILPHVEPPGANNPVHDPPPQRSSCTTARQPVSTTRLDNAVQASKDSAERLRLQKQDRLCTIADLHRNVPDPPIPTMDNHELQQALSSIQFTLDLPDLNPNLAITSDDTLTGGTPRFSELENLLKILMFGQIF
jgi:hypothetical protein